MSSTTLARSLVQRTRQWTIAAFTALCCAVALVLAPVGPVFGQLEATLPPSVSDAWALADARRARGDLLEANRALQAAEDRARGDAEISGTALRRAIVFADLGQLQDARAQLARAESSIDGLSAQERPRLAETLAGIDARQGAYSAAELGFLRAADEFRAVGATLGEVRSRANALRARMDARQIEGLEPRLQELAVLSAGLQPGEASAMALLAVGDLHRRAVMEFRSPDPLLGTAHSNFERALAFAESDHTRAFALGFQGGLYEDAERWEEARRLTSRALFLAQASNAQDQIYRWEWQLARIQRAEGALAASAESMDRALVALGGIRADVLQSSRNAFGSIVEPAYLDYADVNLRRAALMGDDIPAQQATLRGVRDQLESLKQAEMQDYFQDECVAADAASTDGVVDLPGVAVLYPVMLADRIELLVETRGTLRRFASPVSRGEVTVTTRRLRVGLEQPAAGDAYLESAQALHRWLIAEAEPWLIENDVDTLVFVPSGALRTIPLSALHDGQQFVIEKFSVATTPAVSLVTPLTPDRLSQLFVAGLTESVQGFSELPSVAEEMRALSAMFPGTSLKNESFQLAAVETGLSSRTYSVAHLATHGEFSSNHQDSFVLTFDDRLTMDRLQNVLGRRGDAPLDLLVLSACRTAAGDDRAALGLAGVAVQAGAKSAVASLWYISDAATASLMSNFYANLKSGNLTTAGSLRAAQLDLLQSPEYRHPSFWAPYLLIGNWL